MALWVMSLLTVASLLTFSVIASVAGSHQETKSLTRFHDPVIVRTSFLTGLPTRHTVGYRLYSARQGIVVPIPFQFDERDQSGEIVFPGPDASREFTFDENDELVFMAKDTGDRILPDDLPSENNGIVEIEVTDPVNSGKGWAYLLHFPEPFPPLSPVTYATFDAKANQARTLFYTMDYYPKRNFFTAMRIHAAAGGTGENILDRMKFRIHPTFSLLVTTWSPLITEQDITTTIDGVKNGPVRAIRRVRQAIDLSQYFPSIPNGTTYTYFYFSSLITPSTFRVPWLVLKLLRDLHFVGASDFRKNALGMEYWDEANSKGLYFTGTGDAHVMTTKDHDWYVVSGQAGTHLQAFMIPDQWRQWGIVRGTVFQDHNQAADQDGPEDELGSHAAGYSLLNMNNLRKSGAYAMNLAIIFLPRRYQPGDEVQPLAMLKQPLVIRTHIIQSRVMVQK